MIRMPSQDEEADATPPPPVDAAPLSRWERLGASVAGVLASGAGVLAVFRTDNQAGTIALILAGALFLLMGVNGAPLVRARYQDYELLMARRRQEIVGSIEQEPTEEAVVALETLRVVDPQADRDPAVQRATAAVYGRQVFDRLRSMENEAEYTDGPGDMGRDAVLPVPGGKIGVMIRGGSRPLTSQDLMMATHIPPGMADAILIVTSKTLPTSFDRRLRDLRDTDPRPFEVVRWMDHQDNAALEEKMNLLKSRLANGG